MSVTRPETPHTLTTALLHALKIVCKKIKHAAFLRGLYKIWLEAAGEIIFESKEETAVSHLKSFTLNPEAKISKIRQKTWKVFRYFIL